MADDNHSSWYVSIVAIIAIVAVVVLVNNANPGSVSSVAGVNEVTGYDVGVDMPEPNYCELVGEFNMGSIKFRGVATRKIGSLEIDRTRGVLYTMRDFQTIGRIDTDGNNMNSEFISLNEENVSIIGFGVNRLNELYALTSKIVNFENYNMNNSIWRFDHNGNLLRTTPLNSGVVRNTDSVEVGDRYLYLLDYQFLSQVPILEGNPLNRVEHHFMVTDSPDPRTTVEDREGNIYIVSNMDNSIKKFDSSLREMEFRVRPRLITTDMTFDDAGRIYLLTKDKTILVYDANREELLYSWRAYEGNSETGYIAVDNDGNIYLADTQKIRKFHCTFPPTRQSPPRPPHPTPPPRYPQYPPAIAKQCFDADGNDIHTNPTTVRSAMIDSCSDRDGGASSAAGEYVIERECRNATTAASVYYRCPSGELCREGKCINATVKSLRGLFPNRRQ